jgi:hypothetical protein
MSKEVKERATAYVVGAVGGAIVILIAGFWFGPLTTNGALSAAVDATVIEQQALFCAERVRADPAYVDASTFKTLGFSAQRDFVALHAQMPDQGSANNAVVNACRRLLQA